MHKNIKLERRLATRCALYRTAGVGGWHVKTKVVATGSPARTTLLHVYPTKTFHTQFHNPWTHFDTARLPPGSVHIRACYCLFLNEKTEFGLFFITDCVFTTYAYVGERIVIPSCTMYCFVCDTLILINSIFFVSLKFVMQTIQKCDENARRCYGKSYIRHWDEILNALWTSGSSVII